MERATGIEPAPSVWKHLVDHPVRSRPVPEQAADLLIHISQIPVRPGAGRAIPHGSLPRSLPSSRPSFDLDLRIRAMRIIVVIVVVLAIAALV
jgi:hypothetical protein